MSSVEIEKKFFIFRKKFPNNPLQFFSNLLFKKLPTCISLLAIATTCAARCFQRAASNAPVKTGG